MKHLRVFLICAMAICLMPLGNLRAGTILRPGGGVYTNSNKTPQFGEPKTAVCKYINPPGRSSFCGKPCMALNMAMMPSSMNLNLVVPNLVDPKSNEPPVEIKGIIEKARSGDLFEVVYKIAGRQAVLDQMKVYDKKPGEDEPGVFIFESTRDEKAGTKEIPCIVLTKFNVSFEFQLPVTKGPTGKLVAKEDIAKVIDGFKAGDSVDVQTMGGRPPIIRSIKAYEPPKWAKFVKLDKQTVDGKELSAVEVDAYGNNVTLVVAAKDKALADKFRLMKADALIIYKATTDDKGTVWLNQVALAPKDATIPPEPAKESASETTKTDKTNKTGKSKDAKKPADKGT